MINPDINALRLILANNKEDIRFWVSLALDLAKVSGTGGAALGLFILLAYLHTSNAPLPIADVSASLAFIVIVAVYASIAILLCALLFSPAVMCGISPRERRRLRVTSINYNVTSRQSLEKLGSQYLLFHGGALGAIVMTSILLTATLSEWTFLTLWLCAVVGGALASVCRFYSHAKLAEKINNRLFKARVAARIFCGSIGRGAWCLVWLLVIFTFIQFFDITSSLIKLSPIVSSIIFSLIFWITATILYCTLTSVRVIRGRIPIVVATVALLAAVFNPSYCGAKSLSFLGLGGGIPVTILTRTMAIGQSTVTGKNIEGCLIINMGGRIVVRPLRNPDVRTCGHSLSNAMLAGVVVMSQTDILTIDGFEPPQ